MFTVAPRIEARRIRKNLLRAVIEVGFIIFLFYSNLLMGEFTRTSMARGKTLAWALRDIATGPNFMIASAAALIGYILVETLRKKL